MTDPFANYKPEDDEQEKLPVIQLSSVDDVFKGTILRIGNEFTQQLDDGKSLVKYPIEVRLNYVRIKPLQHVEDLQKAYDPPAVGTDAVYFVTKLKDNGERHHIQEEIDKAAKRANVDSIGVGGEIAGKLLDKVKNDKFPTRKPFKKHAFMYEPGDPFAATAAPAAAAAPKAAAPADDVAAQIAALQAQLKGNQPADNTPPF